MHKPSRKRSHQTSNAFPVYDHTQHRHLHRQGDSSSPEPSFWGDDTGNGAVGGPLASSSTVVQAYEVSLVHEEPELGRQMELPSTQGGRLLWYGQQASSRVSDHEDEGEGREEDDVVGGWADRFSYLHLLPTTSDLPPPRQGPPSPSISASGWSELPSDTEDTFFFSSDEAQEFQRDKKRRRLEQLREQHLAAREAARSPSPPTQEEPVVWEEDEEPAANILALMKHTAKSLRSSPNPQVLTLRILTNHSSDPRFAFLRGRYKREWERMLDPPPAPVPLKKEELPKGVTGLLGGYGSDSDDEEDSDEGSGPAPPKEEPEAPPPPPPPQTLEEMEAEVEAEEVRKAQEKRRRLEKLAEWRAMRGGGSG